MTSSKGICSNGEFTGDSRTAEGELVEEGCISLRDQTESTHNTKEKRKREQAFSAVLSVARVARANPEKVIEKDGRGNRNKLSRQAICSTRSKSHS